MTYVECIFYDFNRARAPLTSFYLIGRRRDAIRQWRKRVCSELIMVVHLLYRPGFQHS